MTKKKSIWYRLYHGETKIDFVGRTKLWFTLSALVIAVGMGSVGLRGLDFGLEFVGGSAWEVPSATMTVDDARKVAESQGLSEANVQTIGSGGENRRVRVEAEPNDQKTQDAVAAALAKEAKISPSAVSKTSVGPSWGRQISSSAIRALILFLFLISLYITWRFEFKMAIATLVALFHDLLVTIGVYSLAGFRVTPATVIAVLTIQGYSIYDGIVVFDKVEENQKSLAMSGKMTYGDMVNVSLNEVLMRSLNTSITALLPILSLLIIGAGLLGASTLQEFALALLIGLAAGAYSSIFIASPLLAVLKSREPRYVAAAERLTSRRASNLTAAAAGTGGGISGAEGASVAPRPRKKRRR